MERHINANITKVFEDVTAVQDVVATVQEDVAAVKEDVVAVAVNVERNSANITKVLEGVAAVAGDVQRNNADITTLARRGTWCGWQYAWAAVGTITWGDIYYSDSNMDITVTPLDRDTGNNNH